MINIAYVIDTIATPRAGTEKQLLMLLKGLGRDRFNPTLVCLRNSEWLEEQSLSCDLEILNLGSILRPDFFGAASRFKKLHRERKFDIVQTFFLDANLFGTIAARMAGIKNVVSSRRNIGYWHTSFYRTMLRILRRWTPYYLANSKAVLDVSLEAEGIAPENITVIYNGLDLSQFEDIDESIRLKQRHAWGVADNELLVGTVANLRPVKNIPSLISAATRLTKEHADLKFVVVGEGPDREQLQQQIDSARLADRFRLVGAHNNIVPCLAALDVGVQCSKSESFSGSLVEYMAAGLPIVASAVGGNVEAISHEHTGLLYDVRDPDGLTSSISALLSDQEKGLQYGEAARKAAFIDYSEDACVKAHERYYTDIMEKWSRT